ncbi:MAG TPA: LacI family DNA-binding transcriptional regulator [Spirochaetia bacterium]|nr:LacI family DNA-binding transcriptional regulator [Spirochaetia bacterium]
MASRKSSAGREPPRKNPRLSDVARRAGLSPATVSRAFTDRSQLKPETYEKVAEAVKSLNYRRPRRPAAPTRAYTVAVILPSILDPYFSVLLHGIDGVAKTYNCNLLFFDSANSLEVETKNVHRFLESGVSGVILVPSADRSPGYDLLKEHGIPTVLVDRLIEQKDASSVVSNDEEGAYLATKYLVDLGHRSILYVGGEHATSTEKARLTGYRRALSEHGIQGLPGLVTECSFDAESSYAAMSRILDEGSTTFTAVFAGNDLIAIGIKKALEDRGRRVPEEISLVGYGDMPFAGLISLTSVSSPAMEMGKSALTLLVHILEHKFISSRRILLRPTLVLRSSCRQVNGG